MNFVMLLILSIVWGGVVVVAAAGIQRLGLSGSARQMMWRCAALMLLAPFPVACLYAFVGPVFIEPVWNYGDGQAPQIPIVLDQMPELSTVSTVPAQQPWVYNFDLGAAALAFLSAGWLFRAFRARWASKELEAKTRKSAPIKSQNVLNAASFWNQKLGVSRKSEFRLLPGDYSPFTQGIVKPVVYLPNGLERQLCREELGMVVGHELMHVRRLDALWRPLERVTADILWFNPFAWFVRAELDRAREIACDEAMLRSKASPKMYARALVAAARFAEGLSMQAPAAAMFPFNKDKELTERVKRTVDRSSGSSSYAGLAALGVFLLAGLPLAAAQGAGAEKVRAPIPDFSATVILSEQAKISSSYGERKDPNTGEMHFHIGADIAAAKGTPIHAPAHGLVTFAERKGKYGNVVQLKFNDEWFGRFSHMKKIKVEVGDKVNAGDVIGWVGSSGLSTGPHLHMEIHGPTVDYPKTGEQETYDPERMGIALLPALEIRAQQIRELGVVLPKAMNEQAKTEVSKSPVKLDRWAASKKERLEDIELSLDLDIEDKLDDLVEHEIEKKADQLEALADQFDVEMENWGERLGASIEARAAKFERSVEQQVEKLELLSDVDKNALRAKALKIKLKQKDRKNNIQWATAEREKALKAQIAALEQALLQMEGDIASISAEYYEAKNSASASAKYELMAHEMAKKAVEQARGQIATQLIDAQKKLKDIQ